MSLILPELTPLILLQLSRNDIYECMKTSKDLYASLAPVYYHKAVLYQNTHINFLNITKKSQACGSDIGSFVRELEFHKKDRVGGRIRLLNEAQFHDLVRNLPQLQRIFLYRVGYDQYLKYLLTIPLEDTKHMQEVSISDDACHLTTIIENHFFVSLRFKDSIRVLRCMNFAILNHGLPVLSELAKLSHLEELYINDLWILPETGLFSILDTCSNLTKFDGRCVFQCITFVPGNGTVHQRLTSLVLNVDYWTDDQLDSMVRYIPHLQTLNLCMHYHSLTESLLSLREESMLKFYRYLERINQLQLKNIAVPQIRVIQDIPGRTKALTDLVRGVCGENAQCNLKVHFLRLPLKRDYFILNKNGKSVTITTLWLMDIFNDVSWTKQIDFFTFDSITLINTNVRFTKIESMNAILISPILALLKRKQQRTPCPIFLRSFQQRLVFYSKDNTDYYPSTLDGTLLRRHHFTDYHNRSAIHYGLAQKVYLTEDVLLSLGELYASVQELTFQDCAFENATKNKRSYHINLSQFTDIHQFTFNLDSFLSIRKLKQPLYLQFASAKDVQDVEFYLFNERRRNVLQRVEDCHEESIPKSAYIVKITRNRIRQFTFIRRHKAVLIE